MKKIIIVSLGLVILTILFFLAFGRKGEEITSVKNNTNTTNVNKKITPTLVPTIKTEPYVGPRNDGAPETTISPEEDALYTKEAELRDKLPIENNDFSLTFNYRKNSFIINFKKDLSNNTEILKTWLDVNGYKIIPIEKFIVE